MDLKNKEEDKNRFPSILLLSDCFGREGVDVSGWISMLKIFLHITGVFNWVQQWIFTRSNENPELLETKRRIKILEEQVKQLILDQKKLATNSVRNNCTVCTCPRHGDVGVVISGGCVPQAPPPPPPPPPPPLPPVMSLSKRVLAEKNNNTMRSTDKPRKSPLKSLVLTPADLQQIKLTTPKERHPSQNGKRNANGCMQPLITEEDLRNKCLNKVILTTPNKENVKHRLAQEILSFRLKKTEIKRSPGGTPQVNRKRKMRRGSGLAPVMATALRKKFITVHSSPNTSDSSVNSPLSTDTSPFS
ncbi:proline-rich protein 11-like [Mytilus edulis]|uniref:proline-rich protein 11-like n=1 Tax=Mytilus edulis TaxID=6550 RepID=UPI0039EDF734